MQTGSILRNSYSTFAHVSNVVRSEYCKLRSVRSTYWTLGAAVVCNIGLAALVAIFLPEHLKENFDATRASLGGLHLSQIMFGVLGVLVITNEYDSGLIRATLSAVPQRRLLLAAKVVVFTTAALIVGVTSCFAAFFTFQVFLADDSLRVSIADPDVLRAVLGGGLFLTVVGLLGLGLGAITRSSAGAVAALMGLLFVPPLVLELLPGSWQETVGPYVPLVAGSQIYFLRNDDGALGAWTSFGAFFSYTVIALAFAFVSISRRDA